MKDKEVAIPRQIAELGPVARAWAVCNSMPVASRREVLAACRRLGIKASTAAGRYQLWKYSRTQARKARRLPAKVKHQIERVVEHEMR